jgi:SlyX protein
MDKTQNSDVEVLKARIDELETRVAFQEDSLQSLDEVIAEQDLRLSKQQMQMKLLAEKFKAIETKWDQPDIASGSERPPHY